MLIEYKNQLFDALGTINQTKYDLFLDMLEVDARAGNTVLVMGNGGSAAIAEHFSCDHTKGVRKNLSLRPNVVSISSNFSLITAIANDNGYDRIFSDQISYYYSFKNLNHVIAISSSGNSENIVKGLKLCQEYEIYTTALVGFDGGTVLKEKLADNIIHVRYSDYGIVEDAHSAIMHSLARDLINLQ